MFNPFRYTASLFASRVLLVWTALICVVAVSSTASAAAQTEGRRIALVVGNSAYQAAPLTNPANDARDMAQALRQLGFDVIERQNLPLSGFVRAVREFGDVLQEGDTAIFYYAGHGVQVKGRNFLLPVDAVIESEDEVPYLAVDANQILEKMELARSRINVVILDACRNNPFPRVMRNSAQGLAQMEAPKGTLIAFATAPGGVAMDGSESNGVYTKHLLSTLRTPGLPIEMVFKRVRSEVTKETRDMQIPWESSSLTGDFYFINDDSAPMAAKAPAAAPTVLAKAEPSAIRARPSAKPPMVGDLFVYRVLDGEREIDRLNITVSSVGESQLVEHLTRDNYPGFTAERRFSMGFELLPSYTELETPGKVFLTEFSPYGKPTINHLGKEYKFKLQGQIWGQRVSFKAVARVAGWEKLEVPAGTFNALRFDVVTDTQTIAGNSGERLVVTWWYVPHIKRVVKVTRRQSNPWGKGDVTTFELAKFEQR